MQPGVLHAVVVNVQKVSLASKSSCGAQFRMSGLLQYGQIVL